ncbi:hypothetical protein ACYA6X_07230, partial [Klebsiella pneumoniae]
GLNTTSLAQLVLLSTHGSLSVQPSVLTRSLLWAWLLADALMYLIVKSLGSNQHRVYQLWAMNPETLLVRIHRYSHHHQQC